MTATPAPARQDTPAGRAARRPASVRAEGAAASRRRRRRLAQGLPPTDLVDAAPVRAHVRNLIAAGTSWQQVADRAGLSSGTLSHLLYGRGAANPPAARVRPETAEALLAVQPVSRAVGARRRLQALVACGWSGPALADLLGCDRADVTRLLLSDDRVRDSTYRRVCALYDQLWDVAPPLETADQRRSAAKSRNRAARYGWAVPLAWDDDTIDCPDAKPDHGHGRPGAAAERARLVAELTAAGLSATAIARRLEVSERSVHRLRGRAS